MSHWAARYIGMPWVKGGQGPDAFDCWGFVRHVQAAHFGRELQVIDIDAMNILAVMKGIQGHEERQNWDRVEVPEPGDAVLMAHARHPSHVGVWIDADGGGVLHCVQGMGVIFSSMTSLKVSGWGRVEFYRHKDSVCTA